VIIPAHLRQNGYGSAGSAPQRSTARTVINIIQNINAFVRVARLGSFSGAARELGVAPSVVTKRITQLERSLKVQLVVRSTRGLALTVAGERLLPRFVRLVAEFDEIFEGAAPQGGRLEGHLRIKSPTTITSEWLSPLFADFQELNPGVSLEIVMMDRSVNPLEEGFDVAIGALPVTYPNVVDVPLCPYDLVTCCSPGYLRNKPAPQHPTDLVDHECLTTVLFRTTWLFDSSRGALSVEVHSRLHASDSRLLREAARRGLGIAILPRFLAEADLKSGTLVPLLADFPLAQFWTKALVPRMKMNRPIVREIITFLKTRLQNSPIGPASDVGQPS
jgi:DNA-binding transcriptional LysR family regulator